MGASVRLRSTVMLGYRLNCWKHHGAILASHLQVILLGERRTVDDDLARRGLLKIIDATDERRLTWSRKARTLRASRRV